jgi:predicted kinase
MLNEGKVVNFDNKHNNFVVMLGTPGAGKSFIVNTMVNLDNYKIVNVDTERELLAKKMGMNLKDPEQSKKIREITGGTTEDRNRVIRQLKTILSQPRNNNILPNIILDSGGGVPEFITSIIKQANEMGYETSLIYVRTELATALKRNNKRERRLPDSMVKQYHEDVIRSFNVTKDIYDHVWMVRNDEVFDLTNRPSNVTKLNTLQTFEQFIFEKKKESDSDTISKKKAKLAKQENKLKDQIKKEGDKRKDLQQKESDKRKKFS